MLKLREYQTEAIAAIRQAWSDGTRRPAVVLPTGAGKTVVFAHLAAQMRERGVRTLILAHRDELIEQAAGKVRAVAPDLRVGIVKGAQREIRGRDVVVASVQSLARAPRRAELAAAGLRLVVVDECHHAVANTYMAVLRDLGCFDEDPMAGAYAVGVTATLGRSDRVALGQVWQDVAYRRDIVTMIRQGYLVNAKGIRVKVDGLDFGQVKRMHGDYADKALAEAMHASLAPAAIARAYVEHAKDRQGVLFAPGVAMAYEMAEALRPRGSARSASTARPRPPSGARSWPGTPGATYRWSATRWSSPKAGTRRGARRWSSPGPPPAPRCTCRWPAGGYARTRASTTR
jgi:superfamily II DNA or RNA helicase